MDQTRKITINGGDEIFYFLFYTRVVRKRELKSKIDAANDMGRIRTDTPTEDDPKLPSNHWESIDIRIIDVAPNVYLVNKAARLCIGKGELDNYENRIKHIQKLVNRGHESVLEHSNIISLVRIPRNTLCVLGIVDVEALMECLAEAKYLNYSVHMDKESINILIGGSIRAYTNVIKETDIENRMVFIFKDIIQQSAEKEFLSDLIRANVIQERDCTYLPDSKLKYEEYVNDKGEKDEEVVATLVDDPKVITSETVDLLYMQDTMKIYNEVSQYGFKMVDVWKVCTISFLFHDVSRAIGNQLVRHRNGITQESQRYCEHKTDRDKDFVDPIRLHQKHNTGRYKEDEFDERIESEYLRRRNPFTVYKYLRTQNIYKEDARAWLPMNVTTKIMMTFTYKTFAKFYQLRSEKGAQLEIRLLAEQCKKLFLENSKNACEKTDFDDRFIYDNTTYRAFFLINDYNNRLEGGNGIYEDFLESLGKEVKKPKEDENLEVDEEYNNISTEVVEVETDTRLEDMKSVDINSVEDAERYLKKSEEMKNL